VGRTRAAFALAVCLGMAYAPVVVDMAREWWRNETFSHGFLVPLIAGYLAWRKREAVRSAARPAPAGLALILLGLLVYAAAQFAEVEFLSHLSLLIVLAGLLLFAWGRAAFRILAFPYAFLLFLVPWPDTLVEVLSFPMQLLSAKFAAMGVGLLGIPATRDGVDIHLRHYTFAVGAPCSGMRSLVALLAMSALAAYLLRGGRARRVALFLLGLPLALAANVLRITCILLLAHFLGTAVAEGFLHKFSGVLVFVIACLGLLLIGRALRLGIGPLPAGEPASSPLAEAAAARGLTRRSRLVCGALGVLALGLAVAGWVGHPAAPATRADFSPIPAAFGQWRGTDRGGLDRVSAEMLQPDAYLGRLYRRADGYPVDVAVVFGHRKQTFHSPGFCLLGGGWDITRKNQVRLSGTLQANEFYLQRKDEERLVTYWYASYRETTPSWVAFQYRLLRNRLLGRPGSGALIRLTAPIGASAREAEEVTAELAAGLRPGLEKVVGG